MTLWIIVADFPGWEKSYMNVFYNKKRNAFLPNTYEVKQYQALEMSSINELAQ